MHTSSCFPKSSSTPTETFFSPQSRGILRALPTPFFLQGHHFFLGRREKHDMPLFSRCELTAELLILHGIARLAVPERPLDFRNYSAILSTARSGTIVLFFGTRQIGIHLFWLTPEENLVLYTAQVRRLQRRWRGRYNRPRALRHREITGRMPKKRRLRAHRRG